MSQTIPTLSEPYYQIRVRLDDADYLLDFWYGTRDERWRLTLYDADEVRLCTVKLVPFVRLLRFYRYRGGLPPGELLLVAGGDLTPPKLDELGADARCTLVYFPAADVARLAAP